MLDAAVAIAKDALRRKVKPDSLSEKSLRKYLYSPQMSDVDLFLRSSGEQRTSNFLMWQSAYAEMVFLDVLWPDADRRTLWKAIEIYAERERRFGKA
jgi:undecaprenyl diphosphate synthase